MILPPVALPKRSPASWRPRRLASDGARPPDFALQAWNVAPLIPCLRQTSAVVAPASCPRRIAMICSSVTFDLFVAGPLLGPDSRIRWRRYRGSQHSGQSPRRRAHCRAAPVRAGRLRAAGTAGRPGARGPVSALSPCPTAGPVRNARPPASRSRRRDSPPSPCKTARPARPPRHGPSAPILLAAAGSRHIGIRSAPFSGPTRGRTPATIRKPGEGPPLPPTRASRSPRFQEAGERWRNM